MKFMVDQGLPVPSRIDASLYMTSTGATYDQLLQRILDDADTTLPSLGHRACTVRLRPFISSIRASDSNTVSVGLVPTPLW